ncbi:hypothetical protein BVRB_2g041740 [Beta vulgaris subsp. vulgaris]|nr:hypothetical protein BVRB_2g041740 [Beta vulgaris subsp. vulgaris]
MGTEVMTNWRNRRLRSKPHRYRDELSEDDCMPAFDMSADESKYLRDHKEFCDLLSKSGDEDSEEGAEASKKRYATIALSSCDDENYELVETGPLAVAYTPTGRILHFNFKAKDIDEPSAAVETFFGELIETNTNDFTVENVICLGSSDSLPAKPETHGCLYCGSRAIHHPESPMCFRRGGEYHWEFLCSVVPKIRDYIKEGKRNKDGKKFIPRFLHPGIQLVDKLDACSTDKTYATVALRVFNAKEGTNFELVATGCVRQAFTSICFVLHMNFKAKDRNDPNAPVLTFFAEVIISFPIWFADFCKCLGPSDSLPDEADIRGCCYCQSSVHHPPGPGYLTGRSSYRNYN